MTLHTHEDDRPVPTVWRDGMPVTSPARTLVDVSATLQPDQLEAALATAIDLGLATHSGLAQEARGKARSRTIVELLKNRSGG